MFLERAQEMKHFLPQLNKSAIPLCFQNAKSIIPNEEVIL